MLFVFLFMIMRLCGSNNFETLPEELCVLIFKNLNTKNLLKTQEISKNFYKIFEKYFKNYTEKEIEDCIKNLSQFWTKVARKLKDGESICKPQSHLLNTIVVLLIKEIAPFYFCSNSLKLLRDCLRNDFSRKKYEYDLHLTDKIVIHDHSVIIFGEKNKKDSVLIIEGNDYTIIDIQTIDFKEINEQLKNYPFDFNKKLYINFGDTAEENIYTLLKEIKRKNENFFLINVTKIRSIDLRWIRSNVSKNAYVRVNYSKMNTQFLHYCTFYSFCHKNKKRGNMLITNDIDKNNSSLVHRFCGFVENKNSNFCVCCLGKQAFEQLTSFPWYQKIPLFESNVLHTLLISMQTKTADVIIDLLTMLKKSINPKVFLDNFTELENKNDLVLQCKNFEPIFSWLKDSRKKDITKHGFDMQKQLNNYLTEHCF